MEPFISPLGSGLFNELGNHKLMYNPAYIWVRLLYTLLLPFLLCLLLRGKTPRSAASLKSKQGLCFFFLDFNLMTLVGFLPLGLLLIPDNHVTPRLCGDCVWLVTPGGMWVVPRGSHGPTLGKTPH